MASTLNITYSASASITCTLASLATASARSCDAVDNGTNKYIDAILYLAIPLVTGTPASDKAINVWFYGSEDGTNYTDNSLGTDAAVTLRVPTNLRGPFIITTPTAGALTYKATIGSVASFFGGILPRKWGFVIENRTNLAFNATEGNLIKTFTGITYTTT